METIIKAHSTTSPATTKQIDYLTALQEKNAYRYAPDFNHESTIRHIASEPRCLTRDEAVRFYELTKWAATTDANALSKGEASLAISLMKGEASPIELMDIHPERRAAMAYDKDNKGFFIVNEKVLARQNARRAEAGEELVVV